MRRWWLGFLAGILFHWLIASLYCIAGENEILVPALSRNFQYIFLSVTTLLWGILGGAVFTMRGYSRKIKGKRLLFVYCCFLTGALGAPFLYTVSLHILNSPEDIFPKFLRWLEFFNNAVFLTLLIPLFIFCIFFLFLHIFVKKVLGFSFPIYLLVRSMLPFAEKIPPESKFIGYRLLTMFVLSFSWGSIGILFGSLGVLFKEKFFKRSGKDEEKG